MKQGQWTGASSYNFLKKELKDGCISCIHMPEFGTDMWVDDEFLFKGELLPNILATKLLIAGGYPIEYPIMGPAVVTGGTNGAGDTVGLSQTQLAKLQQVVAGG